MTTRSMIDLAITPDFFAAKGSTTFQHEVSDQFYQLKQVALLALTRAGSQSRAAFISASMGTTLGPG